MIINDFVLMK